MKIFLILFMLISGAVCAQCPPCGLDSLVEQQFLSFLGPNEINFGPLPAGENFLFRISGTYSPNGGGGWYDAFGHYQPSEIYYYNGWWTWNDVHPHPCPDQYDSSHTYYFPFVGNGNVERFAVSDEPYWDNSGGLNIELLRCRQGTTVCGDVSGVWDSTGSPYYVTCDVTVPAGQTLEIRPGVQVLFTGHYKFNVFGNLQAIGTEQDSIVFTRAFPTEESKWAGLRAVHAEDTLQLEYVVIEHSSALGGIPDELGGGTWATNSLLEARNSTWRYNYCEDDGGGVRIDSSSYSMFSDCVFKENMAGVEADPIGFGGLSICTHSLVQVTHCLFIGNQSLGFGGGLGFATIDPGLVAEATNCTFYGNVAAISGSAVYGCCESSVVLRNCVLWNNSGGNAIDHWSDATTSATYSNIQGSYPGPGNIDSDPLFVDAENGNFHLQPSSPCIDAGDPNSPPDPDGTIADMGAFYFPQPSLTVSPESLAFGLQDLGADSGLSLLLTNVSTLPCPILSIALGTNAFAFDSSGLNGAVPGLSQFTLPLNFVPTQTGSYEDTLMIVAQSLAPDTLWIPLSGQAEIIPLEPESLVVRKGPLNGTELFWAAVTQTVSGQLVTPDYYIIHAATSPDGPFIPFNVAFTNSYHHPFIVNAQAKYFYHVSAVKE